MREAENKSQASEKATAQAQNNKKKWGWILLIIYSICTMIYGDDIIQK